MVYITANGDIVDGNTPRSTTRPTPNGNLNNVRSTNNTESNQNEVSSGFSMEIFDTWNQKLTDYGVPTFTLPNNWKIRPIVSVSSLLSTVMFGYRGLMMSIILYVIVQVSKNGADNTTGGQQGSSSFQPNLPGRTDRMYQFKSFTGKGQKLGQ
ncbi:hypothetical protein SNEBB_007165 [Seison nebaliae]|nr:hypothetical protein SNEBB_007165 [Seison nebaliae]